MKRLKEVNKKKKTEYGERRRVRGKREGERFVKREKRVRKWEERG